MEEIKHFLESSTIHGLPHISTSRKYARLFWVLIVITGFTVSGFLISIQIVKISSIWIALCVIYYCIICLISYNSVPSFCISWTLSWTCRGEREKKRWRFEVCGPFWTWWQLAKMDEVLPPFPVNRFHFSNRKISMVHDFCTSRTWGYYTHTR